MATFSNTPRPGYIYDTTDGVWYPIGTGSHSHGEIPKTIVDAKGDLIAGTAADTVDRLAVGTNGYVLTADSTTSTGLKWAAGGKVLQVVAATYATQVQSTVTTFIDTNLTATITPSSTSSKILVLVTQAGVYKTETGAGNDVTVKLFRGSTELSRQEGGYTNTSSRLQLGPFGFNYLDSPATTSATTYKTQFASGVAAAGSTYVQANNDTSSIILLEIGA